MRVLLLSGIVFALAACAQSEGDRSEAKDTSSEGAALRPPDIADCVGRIEHHPDDVFAEEAPPIPNAFVSYVAADQGVIAISTTNGSSTCSSLAWVSDIRDMEWLDGERLIGWEWSGYEAFGYHVADRAGSGSVIETGEKPAFSPNRNRLAAVEVSESGWGGLGGFAVWEVTSESLKLLASQTMDNNFEFTPPFRDAFAEWAMAGWSGEDCVAITATPYAMHPTNPMGDRPITYSARAADDWVLTEGSCD